MSFERGREKLANILKQHGWAVELENLDEWTSIFTVFVQQVPLCLECGNILVTRKFVDSRDSQGKPSDVYEDFYCPNCSLRWAKMSPPHEFLRST